MSELDELFTALAFLERERIEAGTDFDRLTRIRARKDELQSRIEAIRYRYELPDRRGELEAELDARLRQLRDIEAKKIRVSVNGGGGTFGDGFAGMQALNLGIEEAHGRDRIVRRISQLRDALARLDGVDEVGAELDALRSGLDHEGRSDAPS